VGGVIVAGVSGASFRMVGPLYGTQVGLAADQIALFLAAYVIGGALAQWPAGWLADRYRPAPRAPVVFGGLDRGLRCHGGKLGVGHSAVLLAAFVFGLATFPIYSISAAHAHDWAERRPARGT
jgi:MFS family permease